MRRNPFIHRGIRGFRIAVAAGVMLAVAGCYMPKSMQVRSGTDPTYSDDEVRFRATLYLRVFNICENADGDFRPAKNKQNQDSLYRFRMTGKANALGNEVHFESGILRSHEIDGFGRTVRIVKPDRNGAGQSGGGQVSAKLTNIEGQLNVLFEKIGQLKTGTGQSMMEKDDPCPTGYRETQKFALRGPEGIKILDSDERLVLAMSSSAKPLVTSLRTLAALRGDSQAATGTALIEEENRVLEILLKLRDEKPVPGNEAPQKAIELLEGKQKGEKNEDVASGPNPAPDQPEPPGILPAPTIPVEPAPTESAEEGTP